MSGIIVGVDGSDHSRRALSWAIREAERRKVPLTVLTVHPDPVRPATGIYWGVPEHSEGSADLEVARTQVRAWADQVASDIGASAPEVQVTVVTGDPASRLIAASRDADLLVVGSRGGGPVVQRLLGSISSKVEHHAACPVVVIPAAGSRSPEDS
jgi:nucleotide-binding universal stress UspA family protein